MQVPTHCCAPHKDTWSSRQRTRGLQSSGQGRCPAETHGRLGCVPGHGKKGDYTQLGGESQAVCTQKNDGLKFLLSAQGITQTQNPDGLVRTREITRAWPLISISVLGQRWNVALREGVEVLDTSKQWAHLPPGHCAISRHHLYYGNQLVGKMADFKETGTNPRFHRGIWHQKLRRHCDNTSSIKKLTVWKVPTVDMRTGSPNKNNNQYYINGHVLGHFTSRTSKRLELQKY